MLIRTAKGGIATRQKLLPQATQALEETADSRRGDELAGPVRRAVSDGAQGRRPRQTLPPRTVRSASAASSARCIYQQTGDLKAVKESLRHSTSELSERYMAAAVSPMLEKVPPG